MKKVPLIAAVGYILYAIGILIFLFGRLNIIINNWHTIKTYPSFSTASLVPLISLVIIGLIVIGSFLMLSYFLIKRKNRKATLILAGIFCIGIPVGTILGGLTIFALTRQEIKEQYSG